jgi:hypothetical protein
MSAPDGVELLVRYRDGSPAKEKQVANQRILNFIAMLPIKT